MMFVKQDLDGWIEISQDIKRNLDKEHREKVEKQYTKEQFAIIIYIEELFSKWVGGDMSWIHQYWITCLYLIVVNCFQIIIFAP